MYDSENIQRNRETFLKLTVITLMSIFCDKLRKSVEQFTTDDIFIDF